MASKVIVKNSVVVGKKPPTAAANKPGELWVNIPDKIIGSFDAAGAPIEFGGGATGALPANSLSWGPDTNTNNSLSWGN